MTVTASIDVFEAAAYALVGERCRQSYLHQVRGGLQSLHTAVELLVRAAATPGDNPALAERAAALARRALQNHEKSMAELFNELAPMQESADSLNVGEVVAEVLRFIRNDAAGRSITFRVESATDVWVMAQPHKLRLLLLGLVTSLIDAAAPGAVIDVAVARAIPHAMIEFRSGVLCPAFPDPQHLWQSGTTPGSAYELLLALTQRWSTANGGRLEPPVDPQVPGALRIYYPLASLPTGALHDAQSIDAAS